MGALNCPVIEHEKILSQFGEIWWHYPSIQAAQENPYVIKYISDVIIWPPIWFVYPSCQHLTSLASGHQYLGCLWRKSQIEQSPSHMRPDTWQLRTYIPDSLTVRNSVLHRSLCGVRSVRLMCPLWYDLSLGYPVQLSKVLVIWRHLALEGVAVKTWKAQSYHLNPPGLFVRGSIFIVPLIYSVQWLCTFDILYTVATSTSPPQLLMRHSFDRFTVTQCIMCFFEVHCYAVYNVFFEVHCYAA